MPSAARGECLIGVAEIIDGTSPIPSDSFGQEASLQSRTRNLSRLSQMGPPDVAYFRKRFTPVMGASRVFGYYHFVRGVDVGSAASISAYLVDLVNNGLDALPWVSTGTWEIVGATYRSYNAISNLDVVVDLKLPGGISAHAIDSTGAKLELTDAIWRETAVCAAIRDMTSTGEHPLYPCLRVMTSSFEHMEKEFLANAQECVQSWKYVGATDSTETDKPSTSSSRIALAISEHFLSFCRYDRAIEFFTSDVIASACSDAIVHAAAAYRLRNDLDAATELIGKAIDMNESSSMAWIGRAKIAAAQGELEEAWKAASKACEFESAGINAFVVLADLCADLQRYSEAFVALNSGNMPQLELDYYLRDLVPNRRNKTSPSSGAANGCDAVSKLAQRLKKERNVFNSKCDDNLSELPGKMMTPTEHDCYSVLVKILNDVGWDRLLAIRGEAFVMETDIEGKNATPGDASGGTDTEAGSSAVGNGNSAEPNSIVPGKEDGAVVADQSSTTIDLETSTEALTDVPISQVSEEEPEAVSEEERKKKSFEETGKVVCKPWLDYLVTVMYEDLRAMAVWNAEERTHSPAPSRTSANGSTRSPGTSSNGLGESTDDIEAGRQVDRPKRSPTEVASTTRRHAADWLRRGELALRLQKVEEAKNAFWTCIKLSEKAKVPSISARLNLMNLAASEGDAATTIECADVIWTYLDSACDRKSSSKPTAPVRNIQRAIFNLTAKLGLRKVREELANLDVDRHRVGTVLLDAVSWNVHGYSS